jgi:hypothetical protein
MHAIFKNTHLVNAIFALNMLGANWNALIWIGHDYNQKEKGSKQFRQKLVSLKVK